MKVIQFVLMSIGIIWCLWAMYKVAKGILLFFGEALESGFRNHFQLDYMGKLCWIVKIFEDKGFVRGPYIESGSEKPGIKMFNPKNTQYVSIYLLAPLDGEIKNISISFDQSNVEMNIPARETDDVKSMINKILNK